MRARIGLLYRPREEIVSGGWKFPEVGFRYRKAETARIAAVERLERTAGLASAVRRLRKAHIAKLSLSKILLLRDCKQPRID
jgi:hypothetical protein